MLHEVLFRSYNQRDDVQGWIYVPAAKVKGVVQLIDCRAGITKDDAMMLNFMNEAGIYYIIAVTKIDKLNKTERAASLEKIGNDPLIAQGTPIIPFSSLKGEGKQELWRAISDCADVKL